VDWIPLTSDRMHWRTPVNLVVSLWIP